MPEQVCDTCREPAPIGELMCQTPGCSGNLIVARSAEARPPPPGPAQSPPADRRRTPRSYELTFLDNGAKVRVEPGAYVLLGRDPRLSKHAGLLTNDTVSRRHATVGVRQDGGGAWIRDEFSINGTYVNNVELDPGAEKSLKHNDRIRLGDVQLKVGLAAVRRPLNDPPDDPGGGGAER